MRLNDPAIAQALGDEKPQEVRDLRLTGVRRLAELAGLPRLCHLEITDSDIADPESLAALTGLTSLQLADVTGLDSSHAAGLRQLKTLCVSHCGAWEPAHLSGLKRLEHLELEHAGVTDVTPLAALKRLKWLSLWGNPLGDLRPLTALKHLQGLELDPDCLEDKSVLREDFFWRVLKCYGDFADEDAPETPARRRPGLPRVTFLADIHSRTHFCRGAALLRLQSGLDRLTVREYGQGRRQNDYDLYLDGLPLAQAHIPSCGTCATSLWQGYGDGLIREEEITAVRDRLNAPWPGLKAACDTLAPLLGLMRSGLYLAADFDLFPVLRSGEHCEAFWRPPRIGSELHFVHYWGRSAMAERLSAPLYLYPSQRPALLREERVAHYRALLREENAFPRAVALYLNGGMALLLDGHHKAAACAAEGVPVRTLVIFGLADEGAVLAAAESGRRLLLRSDPDGGPPFLSDGEDRLISRTLCLQTMPRRRVLASPAEPPAWGEPPAGCDTERLADCPEQGLLVSGTRIPPDQVRASVQEQLRLPPDQRDPETLRALRDYALLFPHSKWLSEGERRWLADFH